MHYLEQVRAEEFRSFQEGNKKINLVIYNFNKRKVRNNNFIILTLP